MLNTVVVFIVVIERFMVALKDLKKWLFMPVATKLCKRLCCKSLFTSKTNQSGLATYAGNTMTHMPCSQQ